MAEELTRESSTCYRRLPTKEGDEGAAYHLHGTDMSVRLPVLTRRVSSRSLEEVSLDIVGHAEGVHQAAIALGHKPPNFVLPKPTDQARAGFTITGRAHITSASFGSISTEGVQERLVAASPLPWFTLEVGDPKASHIVYHRPAEQGSLGSFFLTLFATADRVSWLFDQLDKRPNASLFVRVWFKAFMDHPPSGRAYLEPDRHHEVTDFGLHVEQQEVRDKAEPKPAEDGGQPLASAPTPPSVVAQSDILLGRLVGGVSWLIALQVLILIALVVLRR
jgi:hypothetical protein